MPQTVYILRRAGACYGGHHDSPWDWYRTLGEARFQEGEHKAKFPSAEWRIRAMVIPAILSPIAYKCGHTALADYIDWRVMNDKSDADTAAQEWETMRPDYAASICGDCREARLDAMESDMEAYARFAGGGLRG